MHFAASACQDVHRWRVAHLRCSCRVGVHRESMWAWWQISFQSVRLLTQ
jgi:hypothetical protein